jgi:hypothetical protein
LPYNTFTGRSFGRQIAAGAAVAMVVAGPKAKASGLLASLETPQPRAAFRQLFRQPDMV